MTLTRAQIKAITYNSGPLLIIAGPGTGKTTVITEKISYLIAKKKVKPENILALTFTEKAAGEMEERVDKALPYGYFQTHISTFHSFCDFILRNECIHIRLSPNYKLLTETESVVFFQKHMYQLSLDEYRPLHNPTKFIQSLLTHFSRLKDEDINPQEYTKWAKKHPFSSDEERKKYLELATVYAEYENIKQKNNIMDFADLISYTLKLFRTKPLILKTYRKKFQYVLVDEFQDTNIAQYEIIKLLCPPKQNPLLTIIGDDNQSIYKFRGASVSNILKFMKDYTLAKIVVLTDNFRSVPDILESSYRLIKHNDPDTLEASLNISKKLKSHTASDSEDKIYFDFHPTEFEENRMIANKIKDLVNKHSFKWSDIVILVRAYNHAESLSHTLSQLRIPYILTGRNLLLKEPEIKELIAYLFFLSDIHDSPSLYRVLTSRYIKCDPEDMLQLLSFSKKTSRSLFDSMRMHISWFEKKENPEEYSAYREHAQLLKSSTIKSLSNLYAFFKKQIHNIYQRSTTDIIYQFLNETNTLKTLLNPKTTIDEKIAINITNFLHLLYRIENTISDTSLLNIVDYLQMAMEIKDSHANDIEDYDDYDAVKIMTVHSAKGLEFPIVFLPSLTQTRFPTRDRKDQIPLHDSTIKELLPVGDSHKQEERRLFYVALTRAKKRVYLSCAERYREGKTNLKISQFVYETMGETYMNSVLKKYDYRKKQLSLFDFKDYDKTAAFFKPIKKSVNSISYTQIQTFESCPLKYKYQYILKIPTPPSASTSLGTSIHKALNLFYKKVKDEEKTDISTLKTAFELSWIPIGYSSLDEEKKFKNYAWVMLENYFKKYHKEPLLIRDTEQHFSIKIDGIKIIGVIDRVDQKNDEIEIIDYKTGAKPENKKLQKDIQLSLYSYAAMQKNVYNVSLDKITVTYFYLKDGEKISFKKNKKEIEEMKQKVKNVVKEINKHYFPPKKSKLCKYCPFRINCEAWQ